MSVSSAREGKETQDVEAKKESSHARQIVKKLRDADVMLNAGKELAAQMFSTVITWWIQFGVGE